MATFVCNNCNGVITDQDKFCGHCGSELADVSDAAMPKMTLSNVTHIKGEEFSAEVEAAQYGASADIVFRIRPTFTATFQGVLDASPGSKHNKPIPVKSIGKVDSYNPEMVSLDPNTSSWEDLFGKMSEKDIWDKVVAPALNDKTLGPLFEKWVMQSWKLKFA